MDLGYSLSMTEGLEIELGVIELIGFSILGLVWLFVYEVVYS